MIGKQYEIAIYGHGRRRTGRHVVVRVLAVQRRTAKVLLPTGKQRFIKLSRLPLGVGRGV
jgi:hypothetical protein